MAITVLLAVPALMIARSYAADRWIDDSWTVLFMAAVLVSGYLVSRRLLVSLLVASVLVAVAMWTMAPRLAGGRQVTRGCSTRSLRNRGLACSPASKTLPSPRSSPAL